MLGSKKIEISADDEDEDSTERNDDDNSKKQSNNDIRDEISGQMKWF